MTYTSAQANKLLKKLHDEHAALLDRENRSKDFRAAMGEDGTVRFSAARIPGMFIPLSSRQDDEAALKAACDALGKLRERYNAQR